MEAARGRWADIIKDSYIEDRNKKVWRVAKISDNRVRLIDRAGKEVDIVRPPAGREVTIYTPTEEEAVYTLAAALGARILATRNNRSGAYNCPPPETWDQEAARWHMQRFHRIGVDAMELADIRAIHAEDSEPAVPHEHTEEP